GHAGQDHAGQGAHGPGRPPEDGAAEGRPDPGETAGERPDARCRRYVGPATQARLRARRTPRAPPGGADAPPAAGDGEAPRAARPGAFAAPGHTARWGEAKPRLHEPLTPAQSGAEAPGGQGINASIR